MVKSKIIYFLQISWFCCNGEIQNTIFFALCTVSTAMQLLYVFVQNTTVIEEIITHREESLCKVAFHVMSWHCLNAEIHENIISCNVYSIHFGKPAAASIQGAPRGGSG